MKLQSPQFLMVATLFLTQILRAQTPGWEPKLTRGGDPIVANISGMTVYSIGNAFVMNVSPDFDTNAVLQLDNSGPRRKIQPKKSWEISSNNIGGCPPSLPRSGRMDFEPFSWIHLIDGDPNTAWCSRGQNFTDQEKAWVRIDLPVPQDLREIRLWPRHAIAGQDGKSIWALPADLIVRASSDGYQWRTIYESSNQSIPPEGHPLIIPVNSPLPIRSLWITGSQLPRYPTFEAFAFCLAEVEAIDKAGENVALASRGAGVTVSSASYGSSNKPEEMLSYWPVLYDLGLKWLRVNYFDEVLNWHYVEHEKGQYDIDSVADQVITESSKRGMQIVMTLGYGNWLYAPSPKSNFASGLWVIPRDPPPAPVTAEYLEAYKNYVRVMVRHFRDRVHYFEIWNEPNVPYSWPQGPNVQEFAQLVKAAAPVIRAEAPNAKIILGSLSGSPSRYEVEREHRWLYDCMDQGLGSLVDVIGWHPFYNVDPDSDYFRRYPSLVRDFQAYARAHGFKGAYMATEINWGTWPGEMRKAKIFLRAFVTNLGLGVAPFLNNAFDGSIYWNMSLLRNTFSQQPYNVVMPEAGYYAIRSLATVMEGTSVTTASVTFSDMTIPYSTYAFNVDGKGLLVAVMMPGSSDNDFSRYRQSDITVKNYRASAIRGIDLINGTEQDLRYEQRGDDVVIRGMRIQDYPLILSLVPVTTAKVLKPSQP